MCKVKTIHKTIIHCVQYMNHLFHWILSLCIRQANFSSQFQRIINVYLHINRCKHIVKYNFSHRSFLDVNFWGRSHFLVIEKNQKFNLIEEFVNHTDMYQYEQNCLLIEIFEREREIEKVHPWTCVYEGVTRSFYVISLHWSPVATWYKANQNWMATIKQFHHI